MSLTTDKGIIKLYDGTVVYIIDIQYSSNGTTFWESSYNSGIHLYEGDGVTQLEGHKYMRVKHAGDINYQLPMYITAVDGDSPELRVYDNKVQWKLTEEEVWIDLIDIDTLKGEKGEEGDTGAGLNIDGAGALDLRPACCTSSTTTSSSGCCGSSTSSSVTTNLKLFLSYGNHKMTLDDIGDSLTYWHYNGSVWVQSTSIHEGIYVQGWKATAAADGNSDGLTCNSLGQTVLFSASPAYDSTGMVYVCGNGVWSEDIDIAATTGQVKVSASDGLAFLEQKVDDSTIEAYDSGVGYNDNIRVKAAGITEVEIANSALGNGLTGGSGTVLSVVAGDAIVIDAGGVNIDADELSLTTITGEIKVYETDSVTLGIQAKHIHSNVVDTTKGLQKADLTTGKLEAKVDASSIGFNVSGQLEVLDDGIEGVHLNINTCDANRAMEVVADKLAVKVDNTTIEFNGSGQLAVVAGAPIDLTDLVVASITVNDGGTPGNTVENNVIFRVDAGPTGAIDTSITADAGTETITLNVDVDQAWFDARYAPIGGGGSATWGSITGNIVNDISDAKDYIDTKVPYDTTIGSLRIVSVAGAGGGFPNPGLWLTSSGGINYKLNVDDAGNLFTTTS